MNIFCNPLYISIFAFILISLVVYVIKPKFLFKNNQIIPTGLGYGKTIFSYPVLMILLAIILYIVFSLLSG